MPLSEKTRKKIMKKYKYVFEALAHYDETREKSWGKERIDITLSRSLIKKLKDLKKKTGKPISRIIEQAL